MQDDIITCHLCASKSFTTQAIINNEIEFISASNAHNHNMFELSGSVPDGFLDATFETEQINPNNIRISHPYINCSELNLSSLIKSAYALLQKENTDLEKSIASAMLQIGLMLSSNDNFSTSDLLSLLVSRSDKKLKVKLFDSRYNHLLKFEELFSLLAENRIFLADIHDLCHHGIQQMNAKDYTELLGRAYLNAADNYEKELVKFIHYMSLEYSVTGKNVDNLSVYGCLNWQSPRKSPAEIANYFDVCGECIVKWNGLRALLSLIRRDLQIQNEFMRSPLTDLNTTIESDFNEVDLWKKFQSNPNLAIEMIKIENYPETVDELINRSGTVLSNIVKNEK